MNGTFSRAFGCPMRYIQGPGELKSLPHYVMEYGTSAYILIDGFI